MSSTMPPKIRNPETRLVAEYLQRKVWPSWYRQRVPLGEALPGAVEEHGLAKALRISRPWRPEVDAVAVEDGRLVVIEAKLLKIVDGLAKLPLYASLVPLTPELREHHQLPIVKRLVAPWTSRTMEAMASSAGVEVVVYAPEWIADYMRDVQNYWTAEYRQAREERRRVREALGVE